MKISENDVQNSILELLRFQGLPGVRINNGSVYDPSNQKFRKKHKWETWQGSPLDIFVFLPDGKNCWIEVKADEHEKLSPGQKEWMENTIKNGGIAFKAYSLNCVRDALKNYFTK